MTGDWAPALPVLGMVAAAILSLWGVRLTVRSAERRARAEAEAAAGERGASAQDRLIDQLQEELASHRNAQEARLTAHEERMTRLDRLVDGYRSHAHDLRSHIWDGKPPPPPEWPAGLPR